MPQLDPSWHTNATPSLTLGFQSMTPCRRFGISKCICHAFIPLNHVSEYILHPSAEDNKSDFSVAEKIQTRQCDRPGLVPRGRSERGLVIQLCYPNTGGLLRAPVHNSTQKQLVRRVCFGEVAVHQEDKGKR